MPDHVGEEASHASTSKRPRDIPESSQSPPLKRFKTSPAHTTAPTESIIGYDVCPMPRVEDYFYEDLIPKAPELSQLFPTLCHDAYEVRRWLGPVGCVIHWTTVLEDISRTTDVPNQSHLLAGLITHSLAKRHDPQWKVSSPKFHALCETLRSHLGLGVTRRIAVFGEFQQPEFLTEANPNSTSRRGRTSRRTDADGSHPRRSETNARPESRGSTSEGTVQLITTTSIS